jgi:hypothetical protein
MWDKVAFARWVMGRSLDRLGDTGGVYSDRPRRPRHPRFYGTQLLPGEQTQSMPGDDRTDTEDMYSSGALAKFDIARAERHWWARLINWIVEARSHRVICLVLGIWLFNGFDLAFTILSHDQGLLHEENPLARHMLAYGTASIVLYKIGLVLIGSYPLLRFRAARITELGSFMILIAYGLLAVHWAECYSLYDFTALHNIELARSHALGSMLPQ